MVGPMQGLESLLKTKEGINTRAEHVLEGKGTY